MTEASAERLRALDPIVEAWKAHFGDRLVSVVLFGSTARGDAGPDSDVDVLVVATGFPWDLAERAAELRAHWHHPAFLELVTKTPEEARVVSPLYLDMTDDAVLLVDRDGFFAEVLAGLRARMRALGSRRVHQPDGSWYWDLKPGAVFGDRVEL